ncbi:MAG TPA: acylphosphatase [Spirochaetota bacterium]|nr:acylphosphatase [Spirochaetota bacterium]HPJ39848.1 acylphosphatase [Spirochaetota bacterium]HPQ52211.1 acylphosphatase [Spirochaetota bacterium]
MKELILRGRVQGVACRYYCIENAKALGLRASAENLLDGTVRVVLDTEDDSAVKKFITYLRENPRNVRFWGTITGIEQR